MFGQVSGTLILVDASIAVKLNRSWLVELVRVTFRVTEPSPFTIDEFTVPPNAEAAADIVHPPHRSGLSGIKVISCVNPLVLVTAPEIVRLDGERDSTV